MDKVIIALIGTHGVGKTTHLSALERQLEERGFRCKLVEMGGGYFRFFSMPVLCLFRLVGRERTVIGRLKTGGNARLVRLRHPDLKHQNTLIKTLWSILLLLDMFILNKFKTFSFRTDAILCDRCIFDSILEIMMFSSDYMVYRGRVGRFFVSLLRPTLTLLLDADTEVVWNRRFWSSIEALHSSRIVYRKMASDLAIHIINTNRPFKIAHRDIINYVQKTINVQLT